MKLSRRPQFFAGMSVLCFAMLAVTPSDFHNVNYVTGGLSAFWAIMLGLDEILAQRRLDRRERPK